MIKSATSFLLAYIFKYMSNATRFNKAQTYWHTRDKLLYFTIKFKSNMHKKGRIVVVAKGHNILSCIYISIYFSIKARLSFPLWTTNFCQKCGNNNHLTRIKCSESYHLFNPGEWDHAWLHWVTDRDCVASMNVLMLMRCSSRDRRHWLPIPVASLG